MDVRFTLKEVQDIVQKALVQYSSDVSIQIRNSDIYSVILPEHKGAGGAHYCLIYRPYLASSVIPPDFSINVIDADNFTIEVERIELNFESSKCKDTERIVEAVKLARKNLPTEEEYLNQKKES